MSLRTLAALAAAAVGIAGVIAASPSRAATISHAATAAVPAAASAAGNDPAGTTARPSVTRLSATSSVRAGGAVLTVTGKNFRKVREVEFGATPGTGLSVTSAASLKITVPPHAAGLVDVRVVTAYGTSPAVRADRFTYTTGMPDITWHVSKAAGDGSGGVNAVSCLSPTDCLAIDYGGNALTWNGSTWSRPVPAFPASAGIDSLSCPTAAFCVAVGSTMLNGIWTGHAGAWTKNSPPGTHQWDEVSCPTATFCAAVADGGYVSDYDGTRWSAPVAIAPSTHDSFTISCASPMACWAAEFAASFTWNGTAWAPSTAVVASFTSRPACAPGGFCIATAGGAAYTFNGTSWTKTGATMPFDPYAEQVSCTAATFCLDVGGEDASIYNGTSWTKPAQVITDTGFWAPLGVACAGQSCVAVAAAALPGAGDSAAVTGAVSYTGGTWSRPATLETTDALDAVSCPNAGFCAAVGLGSSGFAVTAHHGTWGAPVPLVASEVSCASAAFCLAAGRNDNGTVLQGWRYNGSSWQRTSAPDSASGVEGLDCLSQKFCAGAGIGLQVFNGKGWSTPVLTDTSWTTVSCASPTYCVAGAAAAVSVFNGKTWSAPQPAPFDAQHSQGLASLSCPVAGFCGFADGWGQVGMLINGKQWIFGKASVGVAAPSGSLQGTVSCTSRYFCAAAGANGETAVFNGSTWRGDNVAVPVEEIINGISCGSPLYCVAVDNLGNAITGS
jgi:hypothetical protein